ncbi:fungal-specific transcription factor domain-containing protein [Paraphoma chrysanthemicola]|uniref:Fungal-specific transcription factor domain-containing protein n=1 Tax=Paraphoma chrysanthemicola TaxID=798071 RepID=A0A8K0QX19_9PLEO|nr:fungal-specific transcription factor domain-containing protein [Paraphoma chrysanthemicola]
MLPQEQSSGDGAASSANPALQNRRSLPRASHACQWCRQKKAKCDQQRPCSTCIKQNVDCVYGIRRRNGRKRNVQGQAREEILIGQVQSPLQRSSLSRQDETIQSETASRAQDSACLVFTPQPPSAHDEDVVGDVNRHTHGTEFYGTSSNFVLLNQLFAFARQHLPAGPASPEGRNGTSYLSPLSLSRNQSSSFQGDLGPLQAGASATEQNIAALPQKQISVINLLSNDETLSPLSRPKTPIYAANKRQTDFRCPALVSSRVRDRSEPGVEYGPSLDQDPSDRPAPINPVQMSQRRLEREYVRSYLNNLHHLHPMLDSPAFTARCEKEIWDAHNPLHRKKRLRHFSALYNIVVAIGALVAGSYIAQDFGRDIKICMEALAQPQGSIQPLTSQALSKVYFRKSRQLLGDVFEVCSLESAQTLLLMSLYCQNSHKPHACYMYCGQAVRTALAIGLANESVSTPLETRKAARRTWWCIYSHEIDMSCSSGRKDSLGKPHNYHIPLPLIEDQKSTSPVPPETENRSVAMTNEMVHFAAVLRRVSKELYHNSKGLTLSQKYTVSHELDLLLDDWKARLPEWLDFERVSFREEEWSGKQKLVLHLRYLNAKILIHRPFLAASPSRAELQTSRHVALCLDAARETTRVLYDAYAHRHYFRTWWYNSTYTLYAGMIVLYVIMLGQTAVPSSVLLNDVVKAQDILQSMEEAPVARRSADLLREGFEVAQTCIQHRQNPSGLPETNRDRLQPRLDTEDMTVDTENNISSALFSWNVPGSDSGPLLASIIDPNLLQDFTAGINTMPDLDLSTFPFDGFFDEDPHTRSAS